MVHDVQWLRSVVDLGAVSTDRVFPGVQLIDAMPGTRMYNQINARYQNTQPFPLARPCVQGILAQTN